MLIRLIFAAILLTGFAARAQTEAKTEEGWTHSGLLGANISFTSNQNVVGQTDGESDTYGTNLKAMLIHKRPTDEWRSEISYIGSLTKTPAIPRFAKASDEFKLSTIYMFSAWTQPDIGPYVNASAAAPLFKGEDMRAAPQTYRLSRPGAADQVFTAGSTRLTDPLRPLTTKEGAGALWKAVTQPNLKVEVRAGASAMQINADNQLAVNGTSAAGEVQLSELQNVTQGGPEVAVNVRGKIEDNSAYEAGLEAMVPLFNNKPAGDTRDAWSLTNIEANARLTSNIVGWAAFSYEYKLKIEPQLVDRPQQIHLLVLNVNYNLF